jgi:hypothetical protein
VPDDYINLGLADKPRRRSLSYRARNIILAERRAEAELVGKKEGRKERKGLTQLLQLCEI